MTKKAKRLAPTGPTLRELFLKSGNICAFPGCGDLMMDTEGTFVGQVCHIEAAEDGGERFNEAMSNDDRRHVSNLILMCYGHHQKTNDVSAFPTPKLKQIKHDHEKRFSNVDRVILETLTDWTEAITPTRVTNLKELNHILGWAHSDEELALCVAELNILIQSLHKIPVDTRHFTAKVAKRMVKMSDTRAVSSSMSGDLILLHDIANAFQMSSTSLRESIIALETYGLGSIAEMDSDLGFQEAIQIHSLESGWPFWLDLITFCNEADVALEVFTDDLDFARLDT